MKCSVNGCDGISMFKTFRQLHYDRYKRSGEPGPAHKLRRSNGEGTLRPDGYIERTSNGKLMLEHRRIIEQHINRKLMDYEVVHHINGIKTDNRIENLVIMSRIEHASFHNNHGEHKCSTEGCNRLSLARGLCGTHYHKYITPIFRSIDSACISG